MKSHFIIVIFLFSVLWCTAHAQNKMDIEFPEMNRFTNLNLSKVENTSLRMYNISNPGKLHQEINPYASPKITSRNLFMLSYVSTVAVAGLVFQSPYKEIYIPIVGPYLVLAEADYWASPYTELLILSAVSQTVTAVLYVAFKVNILDKIFFVNRNRDNGCSS